MGLKGCLESFVLSTLSQEPIVMVSCAGRGVCDPTETRIDGGITRRRHGTVFPTISLRGWRGGFRHICLGGIWRRLRRLRRARGQSTMREEELCLLEHPWRDYLSVAQQGRFEGKFRGSKVWNFEHEDDKLSFQVRGVHLITCFERECLAT